MVDIWLPVGAAITIATWSFLVRDSPIFRWAERTYIAVAVGHVFVVGLYTMRDRYYPITAGTNYLLIIPAILGYLYLFVLWRRSRWIASYPIAITMGVGLATQVRGTIDADFLGQTLGLIREGGRIVGAPLETAVTSVLTIVITLCSLSYFVFTIKPKGVYGGLYKLGQYFLLAALGAMAGNLLMGKLSIAIATLLRLIFGIQGLG
jgi:hypothetical protein